MVLDITRGIVCWLVRRLRSPLTASNRVDRPAAHTPTRWFQAGNLFRIYRRRVAPRPVGSPVPGGSFRRVVEGERGVMTKQSEGSCLVPGPFGREFGGGRPRIDIYIYMNLRDSGGRHGEGAQKMTVRPVAGSVNCFRTNLYPACGHARQTTTAHDSSQLLQCRQEVST